MKKRLAVTSLLILGLVTTMSVLGLASATAGTNYTNFGPATGIVHRPFTVGGYADFDAYLNRSASGIVQQWTVWASDGRGPQLVQFKPLTTGAPVNITTPFKATCDSSGYISGPAAFTFHQSAYSNGDLTPFFTEGENYFYCVYELGLRAHGTLTFDAAGVNNRQVAFDVHTGTTVSPAGGTYTYTDADGTYTVNVTDVAITGDTSDFVVTFSGRVTSFSNPTLNWGDVSGWYVLIRYDAGAGTVQGAWGPTLPPDAGASYPTTSSTVTMGPAF